MALSVAVVIVLFSVSAALAQDATRVAMGQVRLTTDPRVPIGCTTLGTVSDDSMKDLRRKIVRLGGDTGLLSFPAENLERIQAVVFRCPPPGSAPVPAR